MSASYAVMLATALNYPRSDLSSRVAAWRQIVDIIAQAGHRLESDARENAYAALATLARDVPAAQRRSAAVSLAGRATDPALLAIFTHDLPSIAAPVLVRLVVTNDEWALLIPALPAASRNILRNRRDLPGTALDALRRYAAGDLALPSRGAVDMVDEPVAVAASGTTPIIELVERIERYRQRPAEEFKTNRANDATGIASFFLFETDDDGAIGWIEGVSRTAFIGISLAESALPGGTGVDATAASAWRRRAPLGPSRLLIGGETDVSGDWTIEAAPLFNPSTGRFVGYRGEARRPRLGERAEGQSGTTAGTDAIRQLVHELRTPLNAIQGFAAMIEGQFLGPAASAYRVHARDIALDVERLVASIDDLDLAARLDAGGTGPPRDEIPLRDTVARAVAQVRAQLVGRDVTLTIDGVEHDDRKTPSHSADLIVVRLLAAIAANASSGETIAISFEVKGGQAVARVTRPRALRRLATRELLNPRPGADGAEPSAALLGLGFTLRLCARLAGEQDGHLDILPDAFELSLPEVVAVGARIAR